MVTKKEGGSKNYKTPKDVRVEGITGLYNRGRTYRFKRTVNGRKIQRSLGGSLNKARVEAEKLNYQISNGIDVATEIASQKKLIADVFYESENVASHRKKATVKRYGAVKDVFLYWCGETGLSKIGEVTSRHIDNYLMDRATKPIIPNDHGSRKSTRTINENGVSEKTRLFERNYLASIFEYAVKQGIIKDNPVKNSSVTIKVPRNNINEISERSFTKDEISLLVKAAVIIDEHLRAFGNCTWREILTFFFKTGMRENELLNLQWSDIDWNKGGYGVINLGGKEYSERISLNAYPDATEILKQHVLNKNEGETIFTASDLELLPLYKFPIRSKSGLLELKCGNFIADSGSYFIEHSVAWTPKASTGFVPLSPDAHALLKAIAEKHGQEGFVFCSHNGGKIRTNLLPILKRTVEVANIDVGKRKLTLHSTRHTFGCMLRDNKIPLETIMGLMRHSDIKETLRYAPYSLKEGALAVQVLDS